MRVVEKSAFMIMRYGAGKPGEKCKACMHLKHYQRSNTSCYKCEIYGESHSVATDWKISNPACGKFNQPSEERNAYKLNHTRKPIKEIDGQLELEI